MKQNREVLAGIFRALSNENRMAIFDRIRHRWAPEPSNVPETLTSKDLAHDIDLSTSTVSHHIKELRRAGLVRGQRKGQLMLLSVANESIKAVIDYLKGRRPSK